MTTPLEALRVEQRTGHDCIRACLSSITGLNVPDFTTPFLAEVDIRPFGDSQTWLRSRGWDLMDDTGERPMPGWSLAVGKSPTIPNANHATVAFDGVVVWDPSPHRDDPGRAFDPSGYWPVRQAPAPDTIDSTWAAVEALLPDVAKPKMALYLVGGTYTAQMFLPGPDSPRADGPSPIAALLALAAALEARRDG